MIIISSFKIGFKYVCQRSYKFLIFNTLFLIASLLSAQIKTWNASSNSNWSDPNNWIPVGVPASGDVVIFSNASDFDCEIDTNITIDSISVENTYDGIISQSNGVAISVNTGANFEGGSFIGGDEDISILESFTLNGTDFTSTSSNLHFAEGLDNTSQDISFLSGTFNHNNGLVRFNITSGSTRIIGDVAFYNLYLQGRYRTLNFHNDILVSNDMTVVNSDGSITVDLQDTLTVRGDLIYSGISTNSIDIDNGDSDIGTLKFEGDNLYLLSSSENGGGSASLFISGSGIQTIHAPSSADLCPLPSIKIDCNTLIVDGYINLNGGSWEYINGTLSHPNPFELVLYGNSEIAGNNHTIDALTINGSFSTATLSAPLTIEGDFNVVASNNTSVDVEAPFLLNGNMIINASSDVTLSIGTNQKSIVSGNLTTTGVNDVQINNDTLGVKGNLNIGHSGSGGGGTGVLEFSGGSQLITIDPDLAINEGLLPSLFINMTGTLDFANAGTLNLAGSWHYQRGVLDLTGIIIAVNAISNNSNHALIAGNPHTLNSLRFSGSFGFLDITANVSLTGDLVIESDPASGPAVLTLTDGLTVFGNLSTSGGDDVIINQDTISVVGDLNIDHMGDGNGSGAIEIIGGNNQLFSGADNSSSGSVPDVVVNKSNGVLTLENYITVIGDWTLLDGVIDSQTNGSSLKFMSANPDGVNLDLLGPDGNMVLDTLIVSVNRFGQLNVNGDLLLRGDLVIENSSAINIDTHNLTLGGDWLNNNSTNDGFINSGALVTLNGVNEQIIACPACIGGELFFDLVVNNTSSSLESDIILEDSVQVANSILFTNGVVQTRSDAVLLLRDGTTTNLGSSNAYLNGKFAFEKSTIGNSILNFPLGKGQTYRPIELEVAHSTANSYTYVSEVFNESANGLGYSLPSSISNLSALRYWKVDRINVGGVNDPDTDIDGNALITLHYGLLDEVDDYENLIIAKFDGVNGWDNLGGTASGNGAGTITSLSNPIAFNSFDGEITIGNDVDGSNTLPVELISFEARVVGGVVVLTWSTSLEINNSHFIIESSNDGSRFQFLNSVKGSGNSSKVQKYSIDDYSRLSQKKYYRLIQEDFDGTREILGIIRVNSNDDFARLKLQINQSTRKIGIRGLLEYEEVESIQLYSQEGKLIDQSIDQFSFPIGFALVKVITNYRIEVFRLILN
ncbi:hypothetical protein [Ekhidna sp.]